ncbi:nitroreductase family protein [Aquihabitans sp. G128]|nr:nitroreductase family protein [Aquihabitans sp. G128]
MPALPDGVEPVDLLTGLCTTRAIRRFTSEPIPDADLATLCFAATRAPTGSNRQPFRLLVLRDGERATAAKALLGTSFRALWAAKREADGYDHGTGADTSSPKARQAATMERFVDRFEDTPVVVLACIRPWRGTDLTVGASVYPACQNLLLAARALGYGGVLTMWHGAVDAELHQLLAIPDDVVIAATVALGRPEGHHGTVRRRPVQELVFDGGWEQPAPWATEPPRHPPHGSSAPLGPDRLQAQFPAAEVPKPQVWRAKASRCWPATPASSSPSWFDRARPRSTSDDAFRARSVVGAVKSRRVSMSAARSGSASSAAAS